LRRELPSPHHHENARRGRDQPPDEPAEITEREKERALAAIEMPAGVGDDFRGAAREFALLYLDFCASEIGVILRPWACTW
jgi:hypothetical protein